ncbi:MAG: cupin domain-containing protein [Candidatus Ornithospirochaeta sp.]
MTEKAKEIIRNLDLSPLLGEGGYFRFLHNFGEDSGSIYYLVTEESFSHLHSLTDDELWFFLEGDEAEQTIVDKSGKVEKRVLNNENRNSLVKKNHFQATRIKTPRLGYALFSTVMSPHYRDDMYTSGKEDERMKNIKEIEELL